MNTMGGGTADLSSILGITNVQTLTNRPNTSVSHTRPNTKVSGIFNNKMQNHRRLIKGAETSMAEQNINQNKFEDHTKPNTQFLKVERVF